MLHFVVIYGHDHKTDVYIKEHVPRASNQINDINNNKRYVSFSSNCTKIKAKIFHIQALPFCAGDIISEIHYMLCNIDREVEQGTGLINTLSHSM